MNSDVKPEVYKSRCQKTIVFGQAGFFFFFFPSQNSQGNNFPGTIYGSVNDVIDICVICACVGSPKLPRPEFLLSCLLSSPFSLFPWLLSCFLCSTAVTLKVVGNFLISLKKQALQESFALRRYNVF